MAVKKRTRYEVLARDNYTCRYCRSTENELTIDHVIPTALGGSDDPDNLVAACKDCNAGKSSSNPKAELVAQVSDDAVRWSAAMQSAADRMAAHKGAVAEHLRPWFDEWSMRSGPGWTYKLPSDADEVLTQYRAAGMPLDVLIEAVRVTMRKPNVDNYFRYFRGVANNMLAELQRDAAAILAGPTEAPQVDEWSEGFQAALRDSAVSYSLNSLRDLSAVVDGLKWGWN